MAHTLAIVSQKGGVGKTTSAVNLAAAFGREGREVLLIEVDPQGSVLPSVGCKDLEIRHSLLDLLSDGAISPREAVMSTDVEGISVLPAVAPGREDEVELDRLLTAHPMLLGEVVERLSGQFDLIVLDAPPTLGPVTRATLAAADSFLVPVQAEEYSYRTLDRLFRAVEDVERTLNPDLRCEGLLLTMVDLRTRMSVRVVNQLHENYGDKVLVAMVPRTVSVQDMPVKGKPTVVHAPSSRGGRAYEEVAAELLVSLDIPEEEVQAASMSDGAGVSMAARAGDGAIYDDRPLEAFTGGPMISSFPSTAGAAAANPWARPTNADHFHEDDDLLD